MPQSGAKNYKDISISLYTHRLVLTYLNEHSWKLNAPDMHDFNKMLGISGAEK